MDMEKGGEKKVTERERERETYLQAKSMVGRLRRDGLRGMVFEGEEEGLRAVSKTEGFGKKTEKI